MYLLALKHVKRLYLMLHLQILFNDLKWHNTVCDITVSITVFGVFMSGFIGFYTFSPTFSDGFEIIE